MEIPCPICRKPVELPDELKADLNAMTRDCPRQHHVQDSLVSLRTLFQRAVPYAVTPPAEVNNPAAINSLVNTVRA